MRKVGTFEAKNKLSELLDMVESGEEVLITRHGKEVARLVPPNTRFNQSEAREAARRIREMSRGIRLDGLSIKALIEEGRR